MDMHEFPRKQGNYTEKERLEIAMANINNTDEDDLLDLEAEYGSSFEESPRENRKTGKKDTDEGKTSIGMKIFHALVNVHVLLLLVIIALGFIGISRFKNWGTKVDLAEFFKHNELVVKEDTLDQILPLLDENGQIIRPGEHPTILFMGNAPFADDRDSEDGLVNMIAKEAGATAINCSIAGSTLGITSPEPILNFREYPIDSFNFYWMCHMLCKSNLAFIYEDAKAAFGENVPEGADKVYETVQNIDLNTVDVLAIMYDASDYLEGNKVWDEVNETNISTFVGNLCAGIDLLQEKYPRLRIIVMSPTYAYAIDKDGNYGSSDVYIYGEDGDVLSLYVHQEGHYVVSRGVSFVDNLYSAINEDTAATYLEDNLHLNIEGRKKVAERFLYALNYYKKDTY